MSKPNETKKTSTLKGGYVPPNPVFETGTYSGMLMDIRATLQRPYGAPMGAKATEQRFEFEYHLIDDKSGETTVIDEATSRIYGPNASLLTQRVNELYDTTFTEWSFELEDRIGKNVIVDLEKVDNGSYFKNKIISVKCAD